jgi:hypothetical protein
LLFEKFSNHQPTNMNTDFLTPRANDPVEVRVARQLLALGVRSPDLKIESCDCKHCARGPAPVGLALLYPHNVWASNIEGNMRLLPLPDKDADRLLTDGLLYAAALPHAVLVLFFKSSLRLHGYQVMLPAVYGWAVDHERQGKVPDGLSPQAVQTAIFQAATELKRPIVVEHSEVFYALRGTSPAKGLLFEGEWKGDGLHSFLNLVPHDGEDTLALDSPHHVKYQREDAACIQVYLTDENRLYGRGFEAESFIGRLASRPVGDEYLTRVIQSVCVPDEDTPRGFLNLIPEGTEGGCLSAHPNTLQIVRTALQPAPPLESLTAFSRS